MKKTILTLFWGISIIALFGTSMAWAVPAVAPKIQVAMTTAGSSQTTLEISVPPDGSQTYTYNYSLDGGAIWVLGVDGNLVLNNGMYSANWVADNYTNVLIRVTAQATDTKTSYTMAYPPNPSGHSNYSTNTNICKNCHTTHTAAAKKLLSQANIENLCTSCHGSTANGAKYLVVAGKQVVSVTGSTYNLADSLGGGFPDEANSSRHSYKDAESAAFPPGGKPDSTIKMDCIKCHQGHAANNAPNYNYRILKTSISENSLEYNTTVVGIFAYAEPGLGDSYKTLDEATAWTPVANGVSNFCGSCHNDYNVVGTGETGPANTVFTKNQEDDGQNLFQPQYYRHPNEVTLDTITGVYGVDEEAVTLPLFSSKINCLTCHKAHGSTTTQDDDSLNYLLRLDNRAVCENCHQK